MTPWQLYPSAASAGLDPTLFARPTSVYRGTPFWSWNNRLDAAQLRRQVDMLERMGFGGFHMHSRTGMATEYMGAEFLAIVKDITEYARDKHMLAWLYDEDRWPSGFAGGLVTQDRSYAARHLLWTARRYGHGAAAGETDSLARGARAENGKLIACFDVVLRDGVLASYRRIDPDHTAQAQGMVWYAYIESAQPSPWFNNQTYVDTLNPRAIQCFIEVTHERYRQAVGAHFGKTIPAIFTDEPQFAHKGKFGRADEARDLTIPFTEDLCASYAQAYAGQHLEDHLPELFWELPEGRASVVRYRYHDHVSERFAQAFADTVGAWCKQHGLALTGHMMEEQTLEAQTHAVGEAMRSYRGFQLPGIDLLCDNVEYNTAKQAQSAAHQFGYPGVLSELYGVTDWDFDFVGHKAQGDWQAALGITVRVPHLSWVSMAGEAKRDYPASIFYQSPWWERYPVVEDHFARLNTVLTRGRPQVRVAVIHPVESYWLCYGPDEQTRSECLRREEAFANTTRWLLHGLIDFDFLCESLLPRLCEVKSSPTLTVGRMQYEAVLVPAMRTIRATTLDRLEAFAAAGGTVIFAGEIPALVDAQPSDRAQRLAERCRRIDLERVAVVEALAAHRDVDVRYGVGSPADTLIHQMRVEGDQAYVFLCNTDRRHGRDNMRVRLRGVWALTELDTLTGQTRPRAGQVKDGWTELTHSFTPHGHLLLQLVPGKPATASLEAQPRRTEAARLADPVPVTLTEPNVLLLDLAEWRVHGGAWNAREEVLRIDRAVRKQLGLPDRAGRMAQPWIDPSPAPVAGILELRFPVETSVAVRGAKLAVEDPQAVRLFLDGREVPRDISGGWWVDEAIRTVPLPDLEPGAHELVARIELTRRVNVEWCYLLGDFGVEARGSHARIIPAVRTLAWGDYVPQGLPFYGGNVIYHAAVEIARPGAYALRLDKFKAPLVDVSLNGGAAQPVAFAPFRAELGQLPAGRHKLDLTAYGNRYNCFGALHDALLGRKWVGPYAWRTEGAEWAYEHQLRSTGVLTAPVLEQTM